LKDSINVLYQLKLRLNNYLQEYSHLNELIIKKENKDYFISFQIKDKIEKKEILRNYNDNLNKRIKYLNQQILVINEIVNDFNISYEYRLYNNYLSANEYKERLNSINYLNNKAKTKIEYINNNNNEDQQLTNFKTNINNLVKDLNIILFDDLYKKII